MSLCKVYTISGFKKASASATSRKACRWPETAQPNNAMCSETVSFLALPTKFLCRFLIIPVRAKCPAHMIGAKIVKLLIIYLPPTPWDLFPLSTKYVPQHQFTHSLNQREVIGSRGGDHKITIFRYVTECLPLTLRLLMSYIYIYIYIYIYMEHVFLMFLDHTQRRSTVGRTPLDE